MRFNCLLVAFYVVFQSKLQITDLNDDCLIEIFSMKSLSLMDVCSLGETCKRFQQISQCVFPKNCSIEMTKKDHYDVVSTTKFLNSKKRPSQDIERIFKSFGSFLTEVSIVEQSTFVLNLVSEYCVENLENLMLHSCTIPIVILSVKMEPIFKRLQTLDLRYVDIECDQALFADLDSLVELSVWYVENCSVILENIFPKLERFT